jgi:hypothetical protein
MSCSIKLLYFHLTVSNNNVIWHVLQPPGSASLGSDPYLVVSGLEDWRPMTYEGPSEASQSPRLGYGDLANVFCKRVQKGNESFNL